MYAIYILIALAHICSVIPPVITQANPQASVLSCVSLNLAPDCKGTIVNSFGSGSQIATFTKAQQTFGTYKCLLRFWIETNNNVVLNKDQWLSVADKIDADCKSKHVPFYWQKSENLEKAKNFFIGKFGGETIHIQFTGRVPSRKD